MPIDDGAERAPADLAERHLVPREHDAVDLGAIERPRVVVGALDRPTTPAFGDERSSVVVAACSSRKSADISDSGRRSARSWARRACSPFDSAS